MSEIDLDARYREAVGQWALAILELPGAAGIAMGRVFELASLTGRSVQEIMADVDEAKAEIAASIPPE